ncbi:HlyC/CorC family transporter [Azospirillum sp. RWY-5-1]|uniref:HlyC/CorC family transporter n=1 Tax=Azospirillum oleiclasticum TaxID=2735135 RepID=A0ABX2TDH4_9PROT|nr:hemolysin family protein [Azospirillum oleiclasticum]NYZ16898.1 HlyC/CorC family transporter [Azospirillum oleiclasticum]NYZ21835.1 HlyC/CorC family transporter [Azospirillum oleiclasticum]
MLAFEIAIIVALTLLNGVFAMSELAVVSSRRARLQAMAEDGNHGARAALRLIDEPGRFLSTVQIGITMVGVVAGAFGGATLGDRLGRWLDGIPALAGYGEMLGVGGVLVLITYLSIVLGELIPKRIALKNPERTASLIAPPMRVLSRVAAPFVWLLGASTDLLLRLLGLHGAREETVTEEEVRSMISEGTQTGVFAPAERDMIDGVLRLADRTVRTIMTPRPDVRWLDIADTQEVLLAEIRAGHHSRYPVCRGELDEILGVVHTRDLLDRAVRGESFDLEASVEKPLIVHDGTPILKLLDLMKTTGLHMAMVVDEYGSIEGVVSITDILETIAGDMPEAGEAPEEGAVRREDGSWLVEGWMPVDEFEDRVGVRGLRGAGDFHTMAGFVLNRLGHVPKAGEAVEFGGARFEVVDMDGRRIDKILVVPATDPVSIEAS